MNEKQESFLSSQHPPTHPHTLNRKLIEKKQHEKCDEIEVIIYFEILPIHDGDKTNDGKEEEDICVDFCM